MQVLRRDTHDRPDVWFVREDGMNLAEAIADLRSVFHRDGLARLEQWRDPCAVIAQIRAGDLSFAPDLPVAQGLVHSAMRVCPDG